ncbi:MAG TPA: ABC transporter substrate-binding protein [Firmicutes bacterium]|jgi:multiple sugar transport system substrate-binding protein|nr:ABC transporter substrate-binding protein [Bacillota bacterium]
MKKSVLLVMVTVILIAIFALSGAASAKTKLVLWSYMEGKSQLETFDWICETFNKSQPDIEVSHVYVPFADFKKQLSIGMAAGKLPDLVVIDNPDHAAYAQMGLFADVTPYVSKWSKQFFPGPWKSVTLNGKCYGIPFTSNCLALFYNIDMLKKAGVNPPTTWTELRAAAKKLSGNGVYGLGISAVKSEEGTFQFLPWLLSSGAKIDKLDSKQAIGSFAILNNLVKDGSMPKEVINWSQADVEKQFAAGKLAMMVNGPWNIPAVKSDAPDMKWSVVKIPKDKIYSSVLGGENLGVVKGNNVKAACKFLEFAADPKIVKEYELRYNMFPPRQDVAADKAWTEDPIMQVFMDEMKYAMPRGPHPKWPEISNAMSTALQEVLTGAKTPAQAAKDAQGKVAEVLK